MVDIRSGWFDCTEPSLTTSLHGKQGVQGAFALVQGGSSASNLLEPLHRRDTKVCKVLSHEFGVIRLYRTFSNHIIAEIARCVEFLHLSSGWSSSLQGKEGVQSA